MEREHGDGDDDSMWYPSVIFVHTILHYPGVSNSQAPFCGPLQRKRKMVLKKELQSCRICFKEREKGSRHEWLG